MATARPLSRAPSQASREHWRLFDVGDIVAATDGYYEIIHVSRAVAWVSAVGRSEQKLVEAGTLTLVKPKQPASFARH